MLDRAVSSDEIFPSITPESHEKIFHCISLQHQWPVSTSFSQQFIFQNILIPFYLKLKPLTHRMLSRQSKAARVELICRCPDSQQLTSDYSSKGHKQARKRLLCLPKEEITRRPPTKAVCWLLTQIHMPFFMNDFPVLSATYLSKIDTNKFLLSGFRPPEKC